MMMMMMMFKENCSHLMKAVSHKNCARLYSRQLW